MPSPPIWPPIWPGVAMAKTVKLGHADYDLLARGHWRTCRPDNRTTRLARLRLCESIAREVDATGAVTTHWRTTDKGRLLLSARPLLVG
jgi:hypothetical protein